MDQISHFFLENIGTVQNQEQNKKLRIPYEVGKCEMLKVRLNKGAQY